MSELPGQMDVWQCIDEAVAAAKARASDPATSHRAAGSVNAQKSRSLVLALLRERGPSTDDELYAYAQDTGRPISPSGLRSRRSELAKGGLVFDTGLSRKSALGRRSIVWRAET